MGRRKIEIQAITNERNRSVTLLKRKNGLFKKAYELGVLCSVDIAVIVFEHKPGQPKKVFEYCSSDTKKLVARYTAFTGDRDVKGPGDFDGTGPAELGDDDDAEGDEDMAPNDNEDSQTTPPAQAGPSGTTSSTFGPNLDPTKVNVSHSRLAPAEGRDPVFRALDAVFLPEETRNTVPLPPSRNPPAWHPSRPSSGPRDDESVPTPTPRFPAPQQFPSWDLRAKPMTVAASELGNFDWPTFINTQRAPQNAQASSSRPPPDPSTGYSSLNSLVSPQAWQQFQQQQRQHEQQHEEHPRHQPRRQIHTNPVGSGGGPEDWLDWVATMAPQMPPPHNPNVVYGYEADLAVGLPHPRSHVPAADDLEGSRQRGSSVTSHMSTRATTPPR